MGQAVVEQFKKLLAERGPETRITVGVEIDVNGYPVWREYVITVGELVDIGRDIFNPPAPVPNPIPAPKPEPSPQPIPQPVPDNSRIVTVATERLFLRETASAEDFASIGSVLRGQKLRVVGDGLWLAVLEIDGKKFGEYGYRKFNGSVADKGWVRAAYVG